MKKLYTLIAAVAITVSAFAQVPQKMSYQAVIRDADNEILSSQPVGMQISILQGSETGTPVYEETHSVTTNSNGLVSLEIGSGTVVSGNFSTINWFGAVYFIKTETDPTGGTDYTITGTSQFMSVPYALHAKTALNIVGGIPETDPVFGESVAKGITATDTAYWNNHIVDTQIDSTGIAGLGYVAGPHTIDTDTHIDSTGIAGLGYVAGPHTIDTDTHIDSTGIAGLGYVAGPHTIDTQLDSTGVAALGYVAGPHTIDTQLDSTGIAGLGYVAGPHTIDTQLDSTGVAALGYVAGPHTIDTQLDSTGVAALGYVAGPHTVDTQLDSTGVAALGYVAGPHTVDTQLDSTGVAALGYVAGPHTVEVDGDVTNELQTISRSGTTVTLSDGGGNFEVNTYTAGSGISIANNAISAIPYTAGSGISISNNAISATPYTAGTRISISNNTINSTPYTGGTGISISGNTISATSSSSKDTYYRNDQGYPSSAWSPLITQYENGGYTGRVTLSTYKTNEGTMSSMNGDIEIWNFWATVNGLNEVFIRIEYTDGTTTETDVIRSDFANAPTTIATAGGLMFRYNSTANEGYLEVKAVSGYIYCQVYFTKIIY